MTVKVDGIEVPQIKQSQASELLEDEENVFFYGNKGIGKSSIVREYAEKVKKKLLIFPLATMIPEFIGGVPYAQVSTDKKTEYFTLLLNESLKEMLKCKGRDYVLFFDEMNQAPTEVMNCLYSICHIDPKQREWCGHSLEYAQIVGAGNLNDGTDGTVYLNELPSPLHDRFFVYELVTDNKDVMNYLSNKWKNLPQVKIFIKEMLDSKINPRNIDKCLELLQFKKNPLLLRAKLGTALTQKILDMQKGIEAKDPTVLMKQVKTAYEAFRKQGAVAWGKDKVIKDEKELMSIFKDLLTEEELASIIKGVE